MASFVDVEGSGGVVASVVMQRIVSGFKGFNPEKHFIDGATVAGGGDGVCCIEGLVDMPWPNSDIGEDRDIVTMFVV